MSSRALPVVQSGRALPSSLRGLLCLSLALTSLGGAACTPLRQIHTAHELSSDFEALAPAALGPEQGGVIGRVEVQNQGRDVTPRCAIELSDANHEVLARVSLNDGQQRHGWVFAAVKAGPVYLSRIRCELEPDGPAMGNPDMTYAAEHRSRRLELEVPGNKVVYFGHVKVDMKSDASHLPDAMVLAGEVGRAMASSGEGKNAEVQVVNQVGEAKAEYFRRFGPATTAPTIALAGQASAPAQESQSADAVGFKLGESLATTELRCSSAGNVWQKQDETRGSCKLERTDLGVPIVVNLTVCGGALCEVAVNAGVDGAAWGDLAARHDKLVQLLATSYGPQPKSETEPFDCPSEVTNCFEAGRARKSTTWHWPTAKISMVSVLLDGGPRQGGAPSLWVLYRSTTFAPRPD